MRLRSAALVMAALAAGASGCGLPVDCTVPGASCTGLPEGKGCRTDAQCASGLCFPVAPNGGLGVCRKSCTAAIPCPTGFNCYDPGSGLAAGCVPAPGPDEPWTLRVESLSVPATKPGGQPWDGSSSDVPDPFVCFSGIASTVLCTNEQHGYAASWKTTPFTSKVTTNSLLQTSITVYESDAVFDFTGCEGSCSLLSSWAKETIYGKAFDLRPQWSHQPQVWVMTETDGLRLELHLDPVE